MSRPLLRLCWQGWQLASFYESNLKVAESLLKLTWNVEVVFYICVSYCFFFFTLKSSYVQKLDYKQSYDLVYNHLSQ